MKRAVVNLVLMMMTAVGAEGSTFASCLCVAEVVDASEHDAETATMQVTLDVVKVTEDLTGHGMECFSGYLTENLFSIELQGVTEPLDRGTVIELSFVHISGMMPPDEDGHIREQQSEMWELKTILKNELNQT